MAKILIVNADDCNLTPGVTRAILNCHDRGILTSTTWMINLPHDKKTVLEVKSRKALGIGIHLNLTFGLPVCTPAQVSGLLGPDGRFHKVGRQLSQLPPVQEVRLEYTAQIEKFRRVFGRLPTHLDTHHQVHDHPYYLSILAELANRYGLPLRRSKLLLDEALYDFHFLTTDSLLGDLNPAGYWRRTKLEAALRQLPEGVHEVMCHPGIHDRDLEAASSFREGRVEEMKLFSSPSLRRFTKDCGLQLSHFGLCYT